MLSSTHSKNTSQSKIFAATIAIKNYLKSNDTRTIDMLKKLPSTEHAASSAEEQSDSTSSWLGYGKTLVKSSAAIVGSASTLFNENIVNIKPLSDERKLLAEVYLNNIDEATTEKEKLDFVTELLLKNMQLTVKHLENSENISMHSFFKSYDPHGGSLSKTLRESLDISKPKAHILLEAYVEQLESKTSQTGAEVSK